MSRRNARSRSHATGLAPAAELPVPVEAGSRSFNTSSCRSEGIRTCNGASAIEERLGPRMRRRAMAATGEAARLRRGPAAAPSAWTAAAWIQPPRPAGRYRAGALRGAGWGGPPARQRFQAATAKPPIPCGM